VNVEHSVTVTRATLENETSRRHLVEEARTRLIELGLATAEQLRAEPRMIRSPQPYVGNESLGWVNVTFGWGDG
jgi:hypothetical protein